MRQSAIRNHKSKIPKAVDVFRQRARIVVGDDIGAVIDELRVLLPADDETLNPASESVVFVTHRLLSGRRRNQPVVEIPPIAPEFLALGLHPDIPVFVVNVTGRIGRAHAVELARFVPVTRAPVRCRLTVFIKMHTNRASGDLRRHDFDREPPIRK